MKRKKQGKSVLSGISYLSIIQILNLIIPLITYPKLISVLGFQLYGEFLYVSTIVGYFIIFVNFGFNATATRAVSRCQGRIRALTEVVCYTYIIKLATCFFSFVILFILSVMLSHALDKYLLFLVSLILIYELLFPIWYFQGTGDFKKIAILTFISRLVSLILIVNLINHKEDVYILALVNVIPMIISAAIGFYYVIKDVRLSRFIFKRDLICKHFTDAWVIFSAQSVNQIYENSVRMIIGTYLGGVSLTIYDIAEKIVKLMKMPISSVGGVLFPLVSETKNINISVRYTKWLLLLYTVSFPVMVFILPYALKLFIDDYTSEIVFVYSVLYVSLITAIIKQFFSYSCLIPFGFETDFRASSLLAMLFYIVLMFFSFYKLNFDLDMVIVNYILTEVFLCTCLCLFVVKNGVGVKKDGKC